MLEDKVKQTDLVPSIRMFAISLLLLDVLVQICILQYTLRQDTILMTIWTL